MRTVAVSGGFDPLHVGHVRLFEAARELGDRLVVIVNGDRFLMAKKGYVFMPMEDRIELIAALRAVDQAIACIDPDQTVCQTLEQLRPDIFANGGDRSTCNIPEAEVCRRLGIRMVDRVGGDKVRSSTRIVQAAPKIPAVIE